MTRIVPLAELQVLARFEREKSADGTEIFALTIPVCQTPGLGAVETSSDYATKYAADLPSQTFS